MAGCVPLGNKINGFEVFNEASNSITCTNEDALALPEVMFYGKTQKNKPIFAVMNYSTFKTAKTGMIVASVLAAALGITSIVLGVKLSKKN